MFAKANNHFWPSKLEPESAVQAPLWETGRCKNKYAYENTVVGINAAAMRMATFCTTRVSEYEVAYKSAGGRALLRPQMAHVRPRRITFVIVERIDRRAPTSGLYT
jgi:hypothetical protein